MNKYDSYAINNLGPNGFKYLIKTSKDDFIFRRNEDSSVSVLTNDQKVVNDLSPEDAYYLALWILQST